MGRLEVPLPVIDELRAAISKNEGNLGRVFALLEDGKATNRELVEANAVANAGAAGNARAAIAAILEGRIPTAPSVAMLSGRSIGGLLRANPGFSEATRAYLADLREALERAAVDPVAVESEDRAVADDSRKLEADLENSPGVYAYTLRSFFWFPVKDDPIRRWYKVGKTDRSAGLRVGELMRANGLPEEPWIQAVYRHPEREPADIERDFHRLLQSSGHSRSESRYAGREWFATNLEFLDTIAHTLGCEVIRGNRDNSG